MPVIGAGLHFLVAIFFAIHAIRHRQEMYWLFILFMFPLLGSAVYFVAVYLPNSRLQVSAGRAVRRVAQSLDPGKELRLAQQEYELTPTAQNKMQLAQALLRAGDAQQAAKLFESCLTGVYADDPEIQFNAALAFKDCAQPEKALLLVQELGTTHAGYRSDDVGLLKAHLLSSMGKMAEAEKAFEQVLARSGSVEVKATYAIWLKENGHTNKANSLYDEIKLSMKHWPKHVHALNRHLVQQLERAFSS